jgi:hypothetical protein
LGSFRNSVPGFDPLFPEELTLRLFVLPLARRRTPALETDDRTGPTLRAFMKNNFLALPFCFVNPGDLANTPALTFAPASRGHRPGKPTLGTLGRISEYYAIIRQAGN